MVALGIVEGPAVGAIDHCAAAGRVASERFTAESLAAVAASMRLRRGSSVGIDSVWIRLP